MNKWKGATLILAIGVVLLTVSLVSMYEQYQSTSNPMTTQNSLVGGMAG